MQQGELASGHPGCGILDTDLIAAFDWLCLNWTYKVLIRKGLEKQVIRRLENLYSNSVSIVVVNNVHGKSFREGFKKNINYFHGIFHGRGGGGGVRPIRPNNQFFEAKNETPPNCSKWSET